MANRVDEEPTTATEVEEEPPTLDSLPPEMFMLIATLLDSLGLVHLACVCHAFQERISSAEDAWEAAWETETDGSQMPDTLEVREDYQQRKTTCSAKEAVRSLATLERLQWTNLWEPVAPPAQKKEMDDLFASHYGKTGFVMGGILPRWRQHPAAFMCNGGRTLVMFGGRDVDKDSWFQDTWALDTVEVLRPRAPGDASGEGRDTTTGWTRCEGVDHNDIAPTARCFNSDAGGVRVLRSGSEEWAVLFGGLNSRGDRDNQTWYLGPLNEPIKSWRWVRRPPALEPISSHWPRGP